MIGIGTVIAIGGNEDKRGRATSILAEFIRRAGGADARIAIVPSASMEPVTRGDQYARIFRKLGAACVRVVHPEDGATPDELMTITNATGIFVTGGDQERLMLHLRRAGIDNAIVEAVRSGAVYAGTSAGASAASLQMIAGSKRRRRTDLLEMGNGLGLVPDVIIDQHFSERRRTARLMSATTAHGMTGIGIDENTAVIFDRTGTIEVLGDGTATLVVPEGPHAAHLRLLAAGQRFEADAAPRSTPTKRTLANANAATRVAAS